MIRLGVLAALAMVALVVALRYPKGMLYATIALLPWQGLDFDVGLRLTASRVLLGVLCVVGLGRLLTHRVPRGTFPVSGAMIAIGLYAVLLTLLRLPFLPEASVAGGLLRGPMVRSIVQCIYFLAVAGGGMLVVPLYLREVEDFRRAGRCYLVSLVVLAALGCVQLALWYGTGWNPLPLGLVTRWGEDRSLLIQGSFVFGDVQLNRMNSLGGEPKDLGQSLMVGLFFIQALWLTHPDPALARRLRAPWLLLFLSMLLTFSTSAMCVWPVGSLAQLFLRGVFVRRAAPGAIRAGMDLRGVVGLLLFLAVALAGMPRDFGKGMKLGDLLASRTMERLELEDFDQAISQFLARQPDWLPFGVGLGNAHLYADRYLADTAAEYAQGTAFRSKSGTLRLLSELGVAGLLLWTVAVSSQMRKLQAVMRAAYFAPGERSAALTEVGAPLLLLTGTLALCYLLLAGIEESLFLALGMVVAFTALVRRRLVAALERRRSPGAWRVSAVAGARR